MLKDLEKDKETVWDEKKYICYILCKTKINRQIQMIVKP